MRKMHLLALRGGAACGAQFVECSPEHNDVTCLACIEEHERALKAQEKKAA
jgi:hypothetical protein